MSEMLECQKHKKCPGKNKRNSYIAEFYFAQRFKKRLSKTFFFIEI